MTVGRKDLCDRWRTVGICLTTNVFIWPMEGMKEQSPFGCDIGMMLEKNELQRGK
ncbi:MAG: hypothetical protein IKX48_06575 [Victivallales bacterium]|nr:hypothetical protein [Victivallales bacterium]